MDILSLVVGGLIGAPVGAFVPSVYAKLTKAKAVVVADVAKVQTAAQAVVTDAKKL